MSITRSESYIAKIRSKRALLLSVYHQIGVIYHQDNGLNGTIVECPPDQLYISRIRDKGALLLSVYHQIGVIYCKDKGQGGTIVECLSPDQSHILPG